MKNRQNQFFVVTALLLLFFLAGYPIWKHTFFQKASHSSQVTFSESCDPSYKGKNPKKCFMVKYGYSNAEYEQLSDREKGVDEITLSPSIANLPQNNKTYESGAQKIDYYGLIGPPSQTIQFDFEALLDGDKFLNLNGNVQNEIENKDDLQYYFTFYYEVDNTESFDSVLSYRYPNLKPVTETISTGPTDVTNYNGVKLNVISSTIRSMSEDSKFGSKVTIPFNHDIFKILTPIDRNHIDYDLLYNVAHILGEGQSKIDAAHQIFSFVKMNLMWGGDDIVRQPIDTFLSKVVECGNMNSLVGLMYEMIGGRFRYVSGHDPHIRPKYPSEGHSLIEVYSEKYNQWSIVDTFLDIFAENISASNVTQSKLNNLKVLEIDDGKDGILSFGELFRHRYYGDTLSRLPSASMAYYAGREHEYGLNWKLVEFSPNLDLKTTNNKLYVRARVIKSSCPLRYLDFDSGCYGGVVSYSDWKVKTLELKN